MSVVPYGELRELAQSQIRRECRPFDFDWDAFVADGPEWGVLRSSTGGRCRRSVAAASTFGRRTFRPTPC